MNLNILYRLNRLLLGLLVSPWFVMSRRLVTGCLMLRVVYLAGRMLVFGNLMTRLGSR